MTWDEKLAFFDSIVDACPDFERKAKSLIYTSANGYMFSQLNKAGEIGIRLSKESQQAFTDAHNSGPYKSYGAVLKDYVIIPEAIWENKQLMIDTFNESYQFVMSLPPNKHKK